MITITSDGSLDNLNRANFLSSIELLDSSKEDITKAEALAKSSVSEILESERLEILNAESQKPRNTKRYNNYGENYIDIIESFGIKKLREVV